MVRAREIGVGSIGAWTYTGVMLDRFWDQRVDEQGEFLLCGSHGERLLAEIESESGMLISRFLSRTGQSLTIGIPLI